MNSITPLIALFLISLFLVPSPIVSLTCSEVVKDIGPCVNYMRNGSGKPPVDCCNGAKALASAASGTANMRVACSCLLSASKSMNVNYSITKALPGYCGISLGFTIDPNIDCSTIG